MNLPLHIIVSQYRKDIEKLFFKFGIDAPVTERNIIEAAKQYGHPFTKALKQQLMYSNFDEAGATEEKPTAKTDDIPTWAKIIIAAYTAKQKADNTPEEAAEKKILGLNAYMGAGVIVIVLLIIILIYLRYVKKS